MITVRFPTGFSIQYNDANHVNRDFAGVAKLYEEKGGRLIASVQSQDCVLEYTAPCRMYQGVAAESDALLALTKEIKSLKRKLGVKP